MWGSDSRTCCPERESGPFCISGRGRRRGEGARVSTSVVVIYPLSLIHRRKYNRRRVGNPAAILGRETGTAARTQEKRVRGPHCFPVSIRLPTLFAGLAPITIRMRAVRATLNSAGEFRYQVTKFRSNRAEPISVSVLTVNRPCSLPTLPSIISLSAEVCPTSFRDKIPPLTALLQVSSVSLSQRVSPEGSLEAPPTSWRGITRQARR